MIHRLQEHTQRKNHRACEKSQREQQLNALGEVHAIEADTQNDEQHRQSNPMPVHIDLAIVDIFRFPVLLKGSLHARGISFCCSHKTSSQRRSDAVQGLVLGEHPVPQSVAHAPNCKSNASDNQKPARTAHCGAPGPDAGLAHASNSPVYRKMPIHIASSAKIISKPAKSAKPPATKPYCSSSRTHTGSKSEPSRSAPAQRRFQLARNLTYGWKKAIMMASKPNSMLCACAAIFTALAPCSWP